MACVGGQISAGFVSLCECVGGNLSCAGGGKKDLLIKQFYHYLIIKSCFI